MESCYKCGIDTTRAILSEAISSEGIVSVCRKCSHEDGIPVVKRDVAFQEEKPGVYERLKKISGVEARNEESPEIKDQNESLRSLVEKNYSDNFKEDEEMKQQLIRNFHWIIMRTRRMKKLTQAQLAERIGEPETAVNMLERGKVPEKSMRLIDKIENILGIRIKEQNFQPINTSRELAEESVSNFGRDVSEFGKEENGIQEDGLDMDETRDMTISDIQELQRRKEEEDF